MNIFFDTTVLVAASSKSHLHHAQIYTFNLRDFRLLAPGDLQGKICSP